MCPKSQAAPIGEMFFLMCGPNGQGKVAVLYGFMDPSNTHDGAKVWTLCGFLGEKEAFERLDSAWNAVLDKPCWPKRLSRFHTVECVHGDGEFQGWSFAERLTIWGELISVLINENMLVALGSVAITEDFGRLNTEEIALLNSEGLGDSFDLSLQYVLQTSIRLTRQTSEDESIGLIFDSENPVRTERAHAFSNIYRRKHRLEKWFRGVAFFDSVTFTPLQAADLLAHGTYRYSIKGQRFPQTPDSDFPILPGFLRLIQNISIGGGGGFDLDSMKQLAAQIKARRDGTEPPQSAVSFLAPR